MVAAAQFTIDEQRMVCPRCDSGMVAVYDELDCMICGYVDYSWTPPSSRSRGAGRGAEVRYRLPYVGDSSSMVGNTIIVTVDRRTTKQPLNVSCPFCDGGMEQTSLTCSGKGAREERYICNQSHRVSLMRDREGGLGWR
ncbi:MAG: hypothetical protein QF368_06255 [SAR202 cluster bacterium]|jgi:ribosomal protein S27AE|nr:hypothetical protein [SAR202 cluster bacterium]